MPVAATRAALFEPVPAGVWGFREWVGARVVAGCTDRHTDRPTVLSHLGASILAVEAEQIHGASIAIVERSSPLADPLAGCDALLTSVPGIALVIRTADCLPIFFADPVRGVVGLAHAGWHGLAVHLPLRVVAALRHLYRSRPEDLQVAIGPAIRSCCYEVGSEFSASFGPSIQERAGRRTCDLIDVAVRQMQACGIRRHRIFDVERCTACEPQTWYSLRQEGPSTGRLSSIIMLRP